MYFFGRFLVWTFSRADTGSRTLYIEYGKKSSHPQATHFFEISWR